MPQITLERLSETDDAATILSKLNNNLNIIADVLNGGLDDENLDPNFRIDVSKVVGALPATGGTLAGDIEVDDSDHNIKIDGVDLSEINDKLGALISETWDFCPFTQSVTVDLVDTETTYVQFAVPEGFNGSDFISWISIEGFQIGGDNLDINGFEVMHNIQSSNDTVTMTISGRASVASGNLTTFSINVRCWVLFYRKGLANV